MDGQKKPTRNPNLLPAWITRATDERLTAFKKKTHMSKGKIAEDAINFYLDIIESGKQPQDIWPLGN